MLFKSKPATEPAATPANGPARASLDRHLQKMSSIDAERRQMAERAGKLKADVDAAEACAQSVATLEQSIDAKRVAAAVIGSKPPDLTAELAELEHLQRRHTVLEQRANVARAARQELQAKSEALLRDEYKPLQPQISRLLCDALTERMQSYAQVLQQDHARYHATVRKVFLLAAAVDEVSHANRLGIFLDAQRYEQSVAQLPRHEAFDRLLPDRFAMHADFAKLQKEAEALIGRLLRNEDENDAAS